jgi:type VI protein secretion system component VasK
MRYTYRVYMSGKWGKTVSRLKSLGVGIVATLFMWLAVALTDAATGQGIPGRDAIMFIAILTAFGLSVTLWLVWALTDYSKKAPPPAAEKSKRHTESEDTRLALLLELMNEDERQALKQRLTDGLSGDGEAISLAQLLAAHKNQDSQPR